ncbi:hypothetical protein [Sporosarcina sp. FSL K6-3457]|uniref:hypothetical protein n=1 Tax=Sporosarcina sp. FSL K6-3457 TaxID=2978204 RepID=UPI0030FD10FF
MSTVFDAACLEFNDKRKQIVVQEGRSSIHLSNPSQKTVSLYRVDGCLIKEGRKCDFMLHIDERTACHFIELKGSNIEIAVEQIEATIEHFSKQLIEYQSVSAWIIASKIRTLALRSTKIQKLKKRLKQKKGDLYIKTSGVKEGL